MTISVDAGLLSRVLEKSIPGCVEENNDSDVWVKPEFIFDVCLLLKEDQSLNFDYLVSVSAVDFIEYFEMVYHLVSTSENHRTVLKARCWGREDISVPSVISIWQGADFQEREIYDLMGITFSGHYNLKRIMLWEGFPGHPQRKDYLESPR